jgi:predicted dehydrogenase
MIRLAFVGSSGHLGYVLSELDRFPQMRAVAYAPSFEGEDTTAYAGLPHAVYYPEWRSMLDKARPDIVVACGRHDLNAIIATEAAKHGSHVISEKPAATSLAALDALERAVRANSVQYTMLLGMRYEPAWYTAHDIVREGIIGAPLVISGQKSYRWGHRPPWYARAATYGSTMAWVGIHIFDLARWIGGIPYTSVAAHHANLAHPERPAAQDACAIAATLANGGSAAFTLDYLRPQAAPTHGDDRLRIAGERGILEIHDNGQRLSVITEERHELSWPLSLPERCFLGDMLAKLEGTGNLLVTAEQAWDMTRFSLVAAQAADSGRWVDVSERGVW